MMDHKLTKARKAPTYHNLFKICATPPPSLIVICGQTLTNNQQQYYM